MSQPEIVVLCNPLLDVQATVSADYLAKYDLKDNDAILIEDSANDKRMEIFNDLMTVPDVKFIAGGAGQNTARGIAYIVGPNKVAYFGSVGKDKYSDKLSAENAHAGVKSLYQYQDKIGTGKCAALINGHNRSLVTDLGAANYFTPSHLDENWSIIENGKIFYIGGFHLTVSPESIIKLGEHAAKTDKPFILNFSAPFIPQFFKEPLLKVLPFATHIIANESEAAAFAKVMEYDCDENDLVAIGQKIVGDSNKTVIFTHGIEPTVVVTKESTNKFDVKPLDAAKIVDTNGAGDAFAAGFIAALYKGDNLAKCIDVGQSLACLSIQEIGPSYPKEKFQY